MKMHLQLICGCFFHTWAAMLLKEYVSQFK